jgi:hypothetical protein
MAASLFRTLLSMPSSAQRRATTWTALAALLFAAQVGAFVFQRGAFLEDLPGNSQLQRMALRTFVNVSFVGEVFQVSRGRV